MERTFKAKDRFGAEMEFELNSPTLSIETEGERQYKIAYSRALSEGIFPREKLRQVMKEHNIWTDEDEGKYKKIVAKLALFQIELEKAEAEGNKKKCKDFAQKMATERQNMWELFLIQQSVFMHSAEGVAEIIKTEAMMAASTMIKSTKQRYWKSYSEFVKERDENEQSSVYVNLIEVQNRLLDSLRKEIEDKYPESKHLVHVEKEVVDRALREDVKKEIAKRKKEVVGGSVQNKAKKSKKTATRKNKASVG